MVLQACLNAIGETGKLQYRYFEGANGEVRVGLQSLDSTGEKVYFPPVNPETGSFYTAEEVTKLMGNAEGHQIGAGKAFLEVSVYMDVESQANASYSTDVAGTFLSVRDGVGSTGLVRVDEYGQIKAQLNKEGRWVSYAEAFEPAGIAGPNGEYWYVTETTKMPEKFGPAYEQAPKEFNGGRLAYSSALKRLAYVDAKGNVTGLYNFKDSFIADENNYWVGQENEKGAAIKAIGGENVVFVFGKNPEYNQAVVVNKDGTVNTMGGEHIVNTIRGYFALAYYAKNNNIPSGYLDENFFTDGEGSKLFDPNNPVVMDVVTIWGCKPGKVNYSEPIIITSSRKMIKDEMYFTNPILTYGNGQFEMIEFNTWCENSADCEPLSSYGVILIKRVDSMFITTTDEHSRYNSATTQLGIKSFQLQESTWGSRKNSAKIRTQKVK